MGWFEILRLAKAGVFQTCPLLAKENINQKGVDKKMLGCLMAWRV
jgi:hypothetical protein